MYAADLRRQWEGERKKALNLQKQRQAAAKLRQERFVERRKKLRTERQAAQADARAKFDKRIRGKQASNQVRKSVGGAHIRREVLLEQSKNWIKAENLDMRIEEALDNPVPLAK
ncbi:hypothetical protein COCSUDRAFT_57938 [Coccomyxa subellipsoidea C-169]|uniref:Uncharacterized protein n=1 Tax=Coccomyxa subellipsoidea (strain C-169) TaxID=574566 RepID=I0YP98_COCSC|nr:hypothetical protein COCSUDRAFT_57938 [Coccomyxa subellipsoidea C-169]EIE20217.1 hypothetical protein COCSUDRAFT_57938 [Coccomyxa subellipsoidea C-169]|eukprot:XP_005644761.1 hypothetical protein COCSUDRAFT_57938 [Coccomyxa subellipsoidea C-169]